MNYAAPCSAFLLLSSPSAPFPCACPDSLANGSRLWPQTKIVTPEELERFTFIIDGILATADLETISRKKIRQGLEASLGGRDLSDQKVSPRTDILRNCLELARICRAARANPQPPC